jgi:hypothetical protein
MTTYKQLLAEKEKLHAQFVEVYQSTWTRRLVPPGLDAAARRPGSGRTVTSFSLPSKPSLLRKPILPERCHTVLQSALTSHI